MKAIEAKPQVKSCNTMPQVLMDTSVWGNDLAQLPRLLDPKHVQSKATAVHRLLCSLGDWASATDSQPTSIRGWMTHAYHYKSFMKHFPNNEHVVVLLRASTETVVELMTLIAYPDSRGHGTVMVNQICLLADEIRGGRVARRAAIRERPSPHTAEEAQAVLPAIRIRQHRPRPAGVAVRLPPLGGNAAQECHVPAVASVSREGSPDCQPRNGGGRSGTRRELIASDKAAHQPLAAGTTKQEKP